MNLFTIDLLAKKVPYSVHTLYKKKKKMIIGKHYFQCNNGKILFCDEAVYFLLNITKGKHEIKQRDNIQEERQSVSIHKYFD